MSDLRFDQGGKRPPKNKKNSKIDNVNGFHDHYDYAENKSSHKNGVAHCKDVPPRPRMSIMGLHTWALTIRLFVISSILNKNEFLSYLILLEFLFLG